MPVDDTPRGLIRFFQALLIGAVLSYIGLFLTARTSGIATIWPANAAIVAMLWLVNRRDWSWVMAGAPLGMVATNLILNRDMPASLDVLFPLINLFEISLVVLLNRPQPLDWINAKSRAMALRFLLTAGLLIPALTALVAGSFVSLLSPAPFVETTLLWFAADALGMILFAPLFHYLAGEHGWRRDGSAILHTFAPAVAMAPVVMALFLVPKMPLLFLVLAGVVAIALLTNMASTLLAVLAIGLTAMAMFEGGFRMQAAPQLDQREQLLLVQVFLAVVTHLCHWICAINADRRGLIADLTDREAQLRQVMERTHDLFLRFDPWMGVTFASSAARDMLGLEPEHLLGRSILDLVHRDDHDRVLAAIAASAGAGQGNPHVTFRLCRTIGDCLDCEARFESLRDDEGQIIGYVTSARDVQDRLRKAELERAMAAQLEQRNRLFERAETLAQLGHWSLDAATGRITWSQGLARIVGHTSARQPTLESTQALIHPEDRTEIAATMQAAMVAGRNWSFRTRIVRDDGAVRFVASAGGPIRDSAGTITEFFSIMLDITDEVETHAALTAARDAADASTQAKGHFLATMSHEIRTPMTGVLGMIELLRNQPDQAAQDRYLDNLESSARLLMRVLDDVLDFSRIEAGAVPLEHQPFDVHDLFRRTVELYRPNAEGKAIRLDLRFAGSGTTRLVGDAVRVQQILSNLLANAVKFTTEGGVTVSLIAGTATGKPGFCCEVADTGIGIPLAQQDTIFAPFAQADVTTTREYGGTGLGLAISRELIERMGGTIGVRSIPGHGSTFWIELELPAAPEAEALPAPSPGEPGRSLRVLLAEDNAVTQLLVEALLLRRDAHEVTIVGNGRDAVAAASEQDFDVILMDMQMPVMDGIEATRAIRAGSRNAATPIIAVTADISPVNRARYDGIGLTDFLAKPIDSELLARRMQAVTQRDRGAGTAAAPGLATAPVRGPEPPRDDLADVVRVRQLRQAVGAAKLDEMFDLLAEELERRPREISRLASREAFDDLAVAAHSLKGMAASLGAVRVSMLARDLERAARAGDAAGALRTAEVLHRAAEATRGWITDRNN